MRMANELKSWWKTCNPATNVEIWKVQFKDFIIQGKEKMCR